jgi:L-rhamnose mutarotase
MALLKLNLKNLMWKYQKALPFAKKGEKWVLMKQIYRLKK